MELCTLLKLRNQMFVMVCKRKAFLYGIQHFGSDHIQDYYKCTEFFAKNIFYCIKAKLLRFFPGFLYRYV